MESGRHHRSSRVAELPDAQPAAAEACQQYPPSLGAARRLTRELPLRSSSIARPPLRQEGGGCRQLGRPWEGRRRGTTYRQQEHDLANRAQARHGEGVPLRLVCTTKDGAIECSEKGTGTEGIRTDREPIVIARTVARAHGNRSDSAGESHAPGRNRDCAGSMVTGAHRGRRRGSPLRLPL